MKRMLVLLSFLYFINLKIFQMKVETRMKPLTQFQSLCVPTRGAVPQVTTLGH